MFGKKRCRKCSEKIGKGDNFCPNCGNPIRESIKDFDDEDWGMLGKDDFIQEALDSEIKLPFGFNALFNSIVKNLDKQLKEVDREMGTAKNTLLKENSKTPNKIKQSGGISISISSFGDRAPEIKVSSFGNVPGFKQREQKIKQEIKKIKPTEFSEKNIEKLSTLPKTEPLTNIRRLSNKIVYEIDMPEVKSLNDVSIIQLENSIEIKAVGKNKAYFKLIPINLPIINHKLQKGKLVLELEARG